MGDVSAEPSMEDILSSIKRIIAEDGESPAGRLRRTGRAASAAPVFPPADDPEDRSEVLELNDLAPEAEPAAPAAEPIVSVDALTASRGSLDALTRMIARPEPEPAGEGGKSMDAFVADLLRPLLREWLDAHLPELVEGMVAKEIARITGGR